MNENLTIHKCGRTASPYDTRTLQLARFCPTARMRLPRATIIPEDWLPKPWTGKGNDRYGDCVFASLANLIESWSAIRGPFRRIPDVEVVNTYLKYSPRNSGYNVLESLKRWRKDGFWNDKPWYFCEVNHDDMNQVRQAIDTFGGIHTGAMIPRAWLSAKAWTVSGYPAYGHSMAAIGYDEASIAVRSWTGVYWVTNAAWIKYFDEAYAIIDPSFLNDAGETPQGLDLPALIDAVREVASK